MGQVGRGWLEKRLKLAELLCEAAELEHALACMYLFAAFSLKREEWELDVTPAQLELMRTWERDLLLIARQEMEHLALVSNLLTAIGEAPYLRRPNFPVSGKYYRLDEACRLACFSADALERFIQFEMPDKPDPAMLASVGIKTPPKGMSTIGRLYDESKQLFTDLSRTCATRLFVGPPAAQLTTSPGLRGVTLAPGPTYQVSLTPVTNPVSAVKVIDQIIAEGEGTPDGKSKPHPGRETMSHFERLCQMLKELREQGASFAPARLVVTDELRQRNVASDLQRPEPAGIGLALVELFDLAYETLILLLTRFLAQSHERPAEVNALQNVAFFPMMTAVIRPLGHIMTQIPRAPGSQEMSGPRFTFDRELALLPHPHGAAATIVIHLRLLAARAPACAEDEELADLRPADKRRAGDEPADVRPRFRLMTENLDRMASDFATATAVSPWA